MPLHPAGAGDSDGTDILDCVVIGAGAAGLTAAIYLARFRRRIAVLDGASSRLLMVPTSHNYPGFANGIHGRDLLERLRAQAAHYAVRVETEAVQRLTRREDGSFDAIGAGRQWHARTALLATGVTDVAPPFANVKEALEQGHLRYCPICDGYEAIGKKVAVLGRGNSGLQESIFVRNFAEEVYLCAIGEPLHLTASDRKKLDMAGVQILPQTVSGLALTDEATPRMLLALKDDTRARFDVVYSALGTLVNSGMAQLLGADSTGNGDLFVDAHQQTSVDGLYAAGDLVEGLNQITVAMGQAAIAATAIHNRLRQ